MLSADEVAATPREVLDLRSATWCSTARSSGCSRSTPTGTGSLSGLDARHSQPQAAPVGPADRWCRSLFESAGPWLTDRLVWMRGGLTHRRIARQQGPLGPLIERYGRDWLKQDLHDELQRIKTYFDGGPLDSRRSSAPTARPHRGSGPGPRSRPGRTTRPVSSGSARRAVRGWRPCGSGVGGPRRRPMRLAGRRPRSSGIPLCRRPARPAGRTLTGRPRRRR